MVQCRKLLESNQQNDISQPQPLTQRQQRRDAQCDARRNRLRLDPERDPRHHHNQRGRDVRVEQVVAKAAPQIEDDRQAGEVAGRVFDCAVGRVVAADVLLRQLDFGIDDQRIGHVPDEDQVLDGVRNCSDGEKNSR